jgi:hypothetical protein
MEVNGPVALMKDAWCADQAEDSRRLRSFAEVRFAGPENAA